MVHLAGHRPKAAHLPHQPFIDRDTLGQRLWQEFAGLLAEIKQDGAGLEHADRLAVRPVGIDDGGDLVVGADGEERRRHLLALADVHRDHLVGQPHLLQRDRDLAAVRRVPGVQFDGHFLVSPTIAWACRSPEPAVPYNRALSGCRPRAAATTRGVDGPISALECPRPARIDCAPPQKAPERRLVQISLPRPPRRDHPQAIVRPRRNHAGLGPQERFLFQPQADHARPRGRDAAGGTDL